MVGLERGTVELVPYDPGWKREYTAEVERLESLVGDRVVKFEHAGSTAIEGLAAKPIIDMLAVVDDLDAEADLVAVLENHGYEHRSNDDVPDRLFLVKGPRTARTHYLSLAEYASDCYLEQVVFRDHLRSHPGLAAEYEELKRRLADAHPDDRESYTDAKSSFIEHVLERAMDGA
ncbi:GrpB family protein [Halococcus saccharolyticus]|uniref:Glutamate-rich protein grpB n=1 Tax=Halococcus saccharolyticus DSM 5350 TaxID=1227455 RepID=M0MFL0_9EURY|nr:GrpB family protein [Halococcus saccharolyticus]EMA44486.1 hypothetical protein C449_10406 [Halococcus saccharolyticus DSM 5350]